MLTPFVLLLAFVLVSCQVASSKNSSSTNAGTTPASSPTRVVDFTTPAEPLNVTIKLDDNVTTSKMIGPDGGSVSLTAKDGTVFILDIPANALDAKTNITITSVDSIVGAPLDDGSALAVQLEPSGLFFNEIVTLTILPGKAIPVKNQIIFGYENNGQDYHLAVVDPKSKDIQVKLMEFSGVGVGSGTDSAWASNLQIQANGSRDRLAQKIGAIVQVERQGRLTGEIPDGPDTYTNKEIHSILEQLVDQVVQKELAAAELDCQFAQKAIQDLVTVERQNQLLPSNVDANGDPIPIINDWNGKLAHLQKIWKECKKAYTVSGESNQVSFNGLICGLEYPFEIAATFPGGGSANTNFIPSDVTSGITVVTGGGGGCTQKGGGSYTVTINKDGNGTLKWTTTDTLTCPNINQTSSGTFSLPLTLAPDATCK